MKLNETHFIKLLFSGFVWFGRKYRRLARVMRKIIIYYYFRDFSTFCVKIPFIFLTWSARPMPGATFHFEGRAGGGGQWHFSNLSFHSFDDKMPRNVDPPESMGAVALFTFALVWPCALNKRRHKKRYIHLSLSWNGAHSITSRKCDWKIEYLQLAFIFEFSLTIYNLICHSGSVASSRRFFYMTCNGIVNLFTFTVAFQ